MKPFDPQSYGPVFAELFQPARVMPLGPGDPNRSGQAKLDRLGSAFDHAVVRNPGQADCCRAAAWLYHDFLDEAHTICQDIDTSDGSYWHAILHRREPDYSNSKYWFRRVAAHPVFAALAAQQWPFAFAGWDPLGFVDRCEKAKTDETLAAQCRQAQQREWELLFDHCYRQAVAAGAE